MDFSFPLLFFYKQQFHFCAVIKEVIEPSVQDDKVSTSVTRLDVQVSVLNKKLFYKSNKLAFAFSTNETKSV